METKVKKNKDGSYTVSEDAEYTDEEKQKILSFKYVKQMEKEDEKILSPTNR